MGHYDDDYQIDYEELKANAKKKQRKQLIQVNKGFKLIMDAMRDDWNFRQEVDHWPGYLETETAKLYALYQFQLNIIDGYEEPEDEDQE